LKDLIDRVDQSLFRAVVPAQHKLAWWIDSACGFDVSLYVAISEAIDSLFGIPDEKAGGMGNIENECMVSKRIRV
jgi:hypothetical protein